MNIEKFKTDLENELNQTKKCMNDCKEWESDAYKQYKNNCNFFGKENADSSEWEIATEEYHDAVIQYDIIDRIYEMLIKSL